MPAAESIDQLSRSLDATGEIVAGIRDDQWSNSTPCSAWDVRTLLNHLVSGNRLFAQILHGEPLPPPDELPRLRAADQLGDDPAAAYHESADELVEAFSQPGVLDRIFQIPVGTVPGAVALNIRITEALVHGWDLARATGQPAQLPGDIAEDALAFSRGVAAPNVPRTGHPFGPPQSVPDGAPAIDRLAAFLGRPVS